MITMRMASRSSSIYEMIWFTVALLLMAHVFCGLILGQSGLHLSLFFNQKVA